MTTTHERPASSRLPTGDISYPAFADLLRTTPALRHDPSLAVRVLRESVLQALRLTDTSAIDEFHAAPNPTDLPGWDALLAGVAVFTGAGRVSPGTLQWCAEPSRWNTELFDPLGSGKYRLLEMLRTPAAIRERNVILAAGNLEGV